MSGGDCECCGRGSGGDGDSCCCRGLDSSLRFLICVIRFARGSCARERRLLFRRDFF